MLYNMLFSVTLQCTQGTQFIVVVASNTTLPNYFPLKGSKLQSCWHHITFCHLPVSCHFLQHCHDGKHCDSFDCFQFGLYSSLCRYVDFGHWGCPGSSITPSCISWTPACEAQVGQRTCILCSQSRAKKVAHGSFYMDADYPVTKVLRDPVYIHIQILERTDPNLVLSLGRCWATSDPYPRSLLLWIRG